MFHSVQQGEASIQHGESLTAERNVAATHVEVAACSQQTLPSTTRTPKRLKLVPPSTLCQTRLIDAIASHGGMTLLDICEIVNTKSSTTRGHLEWLVDKRQLYVAHASDLAGLHLNASNRTLFYFRDDSSFTAGLTCAKKVVDMLNGKNVCLGKAPLTPDCQYTKPPCVVINGLVSMSGFSLDGQASHWCESQQSDADLAYNHAIKELDVGKKCFFLKYVRDVCLALAGNANRSCCSHGKSVQITGTKSAVYFLHQNSGHSVQQSPHIDDPTATCCFSVVVNVSKFPVPNTRMGAPSPLVLDHEFCARNHPSATSRQTVDDWIEGGIRGQPTRGGLHPLSAGFAVAKQLEPSADETQRLWLTEALADSSSHADNGLLEARGGTGAFSAAHWHWGPQLANRHVVFCPLALQLPGFTDTGNVARRIDSNRMSCAMLKQWIYGPESQQYFFTLCARLLDDRYDRRLLAFCTEVSQEGPSQIFPWGSTNSEANMYASMVANALSTIGKVHGEDRQLDKKLTALAKGIGIQWMSDLVVYFLLYFYDDCALALRVDGDSTTPEALQLRRILKRESAEREHSTPPFAIVQLDAVIAAFNVRNVSAGQMETLRRMLPNTPLLDIALKCVTGAWQHAPQTARSLLYRRLLLS